MTADELPAAAVHELAKLDAAALEAALSARRHELTCPICNGVTAPCKPGARLRLASIEARRLAARRRHELATTN